MPNMLWSLCSNITTVSCYYMSLSNKKHCSRFVGRQDQYDNYKHSCIAVSLLHEQRTPSTCTMTYAACALQNVHSLPSIARRSAQYRKPPPRTKSECMTLIVIFRVSGSETDESRACCCQSPYVKDSHLTMSSITFTYTASFSMPTCFIAAYIEQKVNVGAVALLA